MTVNLIDDQSRGFDAAALVALAEIVLAEEGFSEDTTVDFAVVADHVIADLNLTHLDVSGPTDVLSFPIESLEPGRVPAVDPGDAPVHLGDVVIAPGYVAEQADRLGVAFEAEMSLMVVHGLLHLMGWDHEVEDEAEAMEARERHLLAMVGVERR